MFFMPQYRVEAQTQTHIKDYIGHLLMPSPFQKTAWNRPQAVRLLSMSGQRKSEGGSLLSSRDTWGISLRIDKARVVWVDTITLALQSNNG